MDLIASIALLLSSGLFLGFLAKKLKLPALVGMIGAGILFGGSVLDILPDSLMAIAPDIRSFALVIILLRAGLSLDLNELKGLKISAVLMCFVPAVFEILAYLVLAHFLLDMSVVDSLLLGSVMAAVSPAVIVPRMLRIKREGYGTKKGIPQIILAGASVDDVFVIILFTSLLSMSSAGELTLDFVWQTPVSIILGITVGLVVGCVLSKAFKKIKIRDTIKIIILICLSALFLFIENTIGDIVPYAGLLSVMSMSILYFKNNKANAEKLSDKLSKIWIVAEVLLFTLVGAVVDLSFLSNNAGILLATITIALIVRMAGVYCCFIRSKLNMSERLFCMISYSPKATVQAAIGAIPLSLGLISGNLILTCAILGIIITAPVGAFFIELSYKKLLDGETLMYKRADNPQQ